MSGTRSTIALWIGALLAGIAMAACSTAPAPRPIIPPIQPSLPTSPIVGIASWYGPGFNGHPTASGQIYNEQDLTAASPTLPLGTRVMVTNLDNNQSVEVTINDRGPYVKGRKIDISHKAAQIIGMIGPGTAPVRIDVLNADRQTRPIGSAPGYYVQIGSFSVETNAENLAQRVSARWPDVHIDPFQDGSEHFYRVRMGAFANYAQAWQRASRVAKLGYPILIVSR